MYLPVRNKKDFVVRYEAGEFGNHSPTWNNWIEWQSDHGERFGKLFHIRNRVAGGKTWYNVHWLALGVKWLEACHECGSSNLYISAMAPTEQTLFQGEVMRGIWGLELTYTTIAKPMRDALRECTKTARGIIANLLIEHYLDANSYNWLRVLLCRYKDHVVEFSCYNTQWGTLPGYNTVFWEVRGGY